MGSTNVFDAIDIQLVINGRLYKPEDIGLFRMLLAFEDDGDSGLELHCTDMDYTITDSIDFQPGQVISVKWGYKLSKDYSEEYSGFVIQKPSTEYGEDGVVATIKAYTKSGLLAASRPQKTYNNRKLADIVKDVASRVQMKVEWSTGAGQEIVPAISHSTWSDRQLLSVLADRYGYQVSYVADTIVFDRITYAETPVHRLVYSKGEDSNIKSATVSMDAKKDAGTAMANSFSSETNTPTVEEGKEPETALAISAVDGFEAAFTKTVGQQPVNAPAVSSPSMLDKFATSVAGLSGGPGNPLAAAAPSEFRQLLSMPDTTQAISSSQASAFKFNTSKKKCGLELDCVGMPALKIRQLVEVVGLSKRDSGNWYVSKAVHEFVKSSGYTTSCECNRSRSNLGHNTDGTNVNTKKAPGAEPGANPAEVKVQVNAVNGEVR